MLAVKERNPLCSHPSVHMVQTKFFRVFNLTDCDEPQRSVQSYKLDGYRCDKDSAFQRNLRVHGLCTWSGLVSEESKNSALKVLQPFVWKLIASYDHVEDEFSDIDQEAMHIVRMPRIGRGKHNIHFDPEESPQHAAVADVARKAHFAELLSNYMGSPCTLRESGISMTRPYNANVQPKTIAPLEQVDGKYAKLYTDENGDVAAGEGMEWHSDGPKGEFTILMALEDVTAEQGSLRAVPGSHKVYVDGEGHSEVQQHCLGCITLLSFCAYSFLLCALFQMCISDVLKRARRAVGRGASRIQLQGRAAHDHRRAHTAQRLAQRLGQVEGHGVVHLRQLLKSE